MFDQLEELPQYLGLNDQVYDVMKSAILRHQLPAGSKLDVALLSQRWKISRSPVNDAIQRLLMEGLVSVVPRKGTFVATMDARDVLELMDVRLMFELRAAELVIHEISETWLQEMEAILHSLDLELQQAKVDIGQYSKLDLAFHALPVTWTHNQKLYKIYQAQNFQWMMTRLYKSFAGHAEHWEIFRAYQSRSLEAVRQAVGAHIEAGKIGVMDAYKSRLT